MLRAWGSKSEISLSRDSYQNAASAANGGQGYQWDCSVANAYN